MFTNTSLNMIKLAPNSYHEGREHQARDGHRHLKFAIPATIVDHKKDMPLSTGMLLLYPFLHAGLSLF